MTAKRCPVCNEKITKKRYLYCPMCGFRLDGVVSKFWLDRVRYLWEREERGKFILKNFPLMRRDHPSKPPIREQLGDFVHMDIFPIHISFLLFSFPLLFRDLYKGGRLVSYYTADEVLKDYNLKERVMINQRRGEWWRTFQDDEIKKYLKNILEQGKLREISSISVNRDRNLINFKLNEVPCSLRTLPPGRQCCLTFFLYGFCESLFDAHWAGEIKNCELLSCDVDVYLTENEDFVEDTLSRISEDMNKESIEKFMNKEMSNIIQCIVDHKSSVPRKRFGDYFHMSLLQVMNFLFIEPSPGHKIVSKYAGRISGERMARHAKVKGLKNALDYIRDLFLYLKAGILRPEENADRIVIKMQESVYASGVSNIDTELCIFLAGIIEGFLNVATGERWDVTEMKCIASGFPECEFHCKTLSRGFNHPLANPRPFV